jgi:glucan phosphoethanolaminetransferase (alkaline phosphatase superfamily)
MFCQNCGAFDTEEAKFCSQCGESLNEVPRKEKFPRLRIWRSRAFLEGVNFFRALFDFSFHQSFSKKIRVLYKLSLFSAFFFALLFILMGFGISQRFGLFTFLMIAFLTFLFMATWSRVILELVSAISHMETRKTPASEKLEPRDQIEWNIER